MIYLDLFLTFFKIGAFTFGGGYAMLPLIQQEVSAHGWMTMQELVNFVAVSESTPGPFAVNISTYVGSVTGGPFGSFCATLGVILPSFLIILLVAKFYSAFKKNKYVAGIMSGLKPAVVGMIAASIISIGTEVFFPQSVTLSVLSSAGFYVSLGIFVLAVILSFKIKVNPILIIIISACLGIVLGCMGLIG